MTHVMLTSANILLGHFRGTIAVTIVLLQTVRKASWQSFVAVVPVPLWLIARKVRLEISWSIWLFTCFLLVRVFFAMFFRRIFVQDSHCSFGYLNIGATVGEFYLMLPVCLLRIFCCQVLVQCGRLRRIVICPVTCRLQHACRHAHSICLQKTQNKIP